MTSQHLHIMEYSNKGAKQSIVFSGQMRVQRAERPKLEKKTYSDKNALFIVLKYRLTKRSKQAVA